MGGEVITGVQANQLPRLQQALAAGGDVNERDTVERTALHYAARKGRVPLMELLLASGADVNAKACVAMTPLWEACENKEEHAALLLVQHGANGNIHGGLEGRTPFQLALRRGLASAAKSMLEAGVADPNIKNWAGDHDALYYVNSGSCSRAQKEELRGLLVQYASLDNAVQSGSPTAIEAIVKQAFATDNLQAALETYVNAAKAAPHIDLDAHRTRLLGSMIRVNRPDIFQVLLYIHKDDAAVPASELLERLRFDDQTTALHVSAFFGIVDMVEYLLTKCDMDPDISDGLGRVPMQLLGDANDPTGQVRALIKQARQRRQFREFTRRLVKCTELVSSEASCDANAERQEVESVANAISSVYELESLAKAISSVYDIRAVFNLGAVAFGDSSDAFKRLLTLSFTQLIEQKMVVADREALFFKMILRECERRRILTEEEVEHWDLQLVKVNMESAAWVQALKQSVLQLEWRANDLDRHASALRQQYQRLHEAVAALQQQGAFAKGVNRLRGLLSAVSVLLSVAGVSGVSDVLDTMVDLSSPLGMMATTFSITEENEFASLEATIQPSSFAVRPGVALLMERAGISSVEVVELVQQLLRLQVQTTVEAADEPVQPADEVETKPVKLSQNEGCEESDLEQFPFHYAVKHSQGDLQAFLNVADFIDENEGDVNTSATVIIHTETMETQRVDANAAVYASYLGYVEIVKNLLRRPDYQPSAQQEKKFVTMQRAHSAKQRRTSAARSA